MERGGTFPVTCLSGICDADTDRKAAAGRDLTTGERLGTDATVPAGVVRVLRE